MHTLSLSRIPMPQGAHGSGRALRGAVGTAGQAGLHRLGTRSRGQAQGRAARQEVVVVVVIVVVIVVVVVVVVVLVVVGVGVEVGVGGRRNCPLAACLLVSLSTVCAYFTLFLKRWYIVPFVYYLTEHIK